MTREKEKRKRAESDPCCEVPDCSEPTYIGWEASDVYKRICKPHHRQHRDTSDLFDLFDVFDIPKLTLGVDVDKFGMLIPYDYQQIVDEIEKKKTAERVKKNKESMERLEEWKKDNGNIRKRKPKPRPR